MRNIVRDIVRRIILLLLLSFTLHPTVMFAQAQQTQVMWDQSNVASATQAQSFIYRMYVTPVGATTANPPIDLTGVLCGGQPPTVQCAIALPPTAAVARTTGARTELSAMDPVTKQESAKSSPFISPVSAPTNVRITN